MVIFGLQPLKRFLKVLKDDSALSEWWRGSGSFFMFAEGWDDRPELLDEYGDLFIGSISFKINATFEVIMIIMPAIIMNIVGIKVLLVISKASITTKCVCIKILRDRIHLNSKFCCCGANFIKKKNDSYNRSSLL